MVKLKVKDLIELFGVSEVTIGNWVKAGMPKSARGEYILKDCFDWWMENINSEGTEEEKSVRDRYWAAKAENEEIKLAKSKEQVVLVGKVCEAWVARATNLRTSLHAQPYRVAAKLEGKSQDEIINILTEENNEMLRNFCRASAYTPAPETADTDNKTGHAKRENKKQPAKKAGSSDKKAGSSVKKSAPKKAAPAKKTVRKTPVKKAPAKKAKKK